MGKEGKGDPCFAAAARGAVPAGWGEKLSRNVADNLLTLRVPFFPPSPRTNSPDARPSPRHTSYTMLTCIRSPLPTRLGARAPAPSTASVRGTPLRGARGVTNGARVCAFFNFKKLRGNAEDAGE